MKIKGTYTISTLTRILLGVLAVFYVVTFAVEATHSHDNIIEKTSSSETGDTGSRADNCHICAYVGHHEVKAIVLVTAPLLELIGFQDYSFRSFGPDLIFQTHLRDFVNRGPPSTLA